MSANYFSPQMNANERKFGFAVSSVHYVGCGLPHQSLPIPGRYGAPQGDFLRARQAAPYALNDIGLIQSANERE